MEEEHYRRIGPRSWIGILIGTVILGLVILSQADDPGPFLLAGAFAAGLILSVVGWRLLEAGYQALRGRG